MLTSAELNVSFNLDINRFIFTDITDYASQSVAFNDIDGVIKITAPSGEIYSGGSPDIDGSTGNRSNITTINVPLLPDGTPEIGNYVFTYEVTDGVDNITIVKQFNLSYIAPTVVLEPTVDCLSPMLTSTDATNYLSGSTVPSTQFTLVYADSGSNTLGLSGEKMGLLSVGDTFNIINSTANDGEYTVLTIAYDQVNDRTNITVASLSDSTVDGFVVTKTNTIYFPSVLGVSPLVGYTAVVSTNSFYSETHEFKVSTTSYYDFGDGVTVVDTTSNTAELKVDCDVRLCEVYCCIDSVLNGYLNNCGVNDVIAESFKQKYILATSHLSALRQAFECGQDDKINTLVQQIFKVTECNPDCSCSDGTPTPITGIGAANITIVQSGDSYTNITSNTVGNTTTYTVSISQSLLDLIADATKDYDVVSTDASVTVTSNTVGSTTTFDLSVPPLDPSVAPKEVMSFQVQIDITGGNPVFTVDNMTIQNESNFTPGTLSISQINPPGYPTYYYQQIFFDSFQTVANANYKVFATPYFLDRPVGALPADSSNPNGVFNRYLTPVVTDLNSGSFTMSFLGVGGYPVDRNGFAAYNKIYFNVQIVE